jgi:hypothetical protein
VQTEVSRNALTGDGAPQGTMDDKTARGITPARCARQIVAATEREKNEIYVGKTERFGVYLKRVSPTLLARVVRRAKVV